MVLVVLTLENILTLGDFRKLSWVCVMFSSQGPDGPPGKLGLPGEMVRKIKFLKFPFNNNAISSTISADPDPSFGKVDF